MATGRTLQVGLTGNFYANYARTDQDLNPSDLKDLLKYTSLNFQLNDGVEDSQCDLLYYSRRTYTPSAAENINLDTDLQNKWGDTLNFYYAKIIIIKNLTVVTTALPNGFLSVNYLDEQYYIGPRGRRVIIERKGIQNNPVQTPGIGGIFTLQSADTIEYDLIIAGSSLLTNPSSIVGSSGL